MKQSDLTTVRLELKLTYKQLEKHDFVIVEDKNILDLTMKSDLTIFEVTVPKKLSHKTYSELL